MLELEFEFDYCFCRFLPPEYVNLELVYHDEAWTAAVIQRITMMSVVMMFTLIGNLAIIIVLTCSRYRKMNSRVNVFIINTRPTKDEEHE